MVHQTVIEQRAATEELRPLESLVGAWRSSGWLVADADPASAASGDVEVARRSDAGAHVVGTDVYEWLEGGHYVVHRVDVSVDDTPVRQLEIIGDYDAENACYAAHSFDDRGNHVVGRISVDADGVWTLRYGAERATLTVAPDGSRMSAYWERTDDGTRWLHWMDMTFTR